MQDYPFYYTLFNMLIWNYCFYIAYKQVFRRGVSLISKGETKSQEKKYKVLFFLFLIYSLWTFFGGDNSRYDEFVIEGSKGGLDAFDMGMESLYIFLATLAGGNVILWKIFVYGSSLILTYFSLKIMKIDNYVTLLCFIVFVFTSYGATRVLLAASVLLFGVSLLTQDSIIKKILGIAISISSLFFHAEMILPILIVPFAFFIKLSKKKIVILLLLFPIVVRLVGLIPEMIGMNYFDFAGEYTNAKMENYVTSEKWGEAGSYYRSITAKIGEYIGWAFVIPSLLLAMAYSIRNKLHNQITHIIDFCFYLFYISFAVFLSDLPIKEIVYARYFQLVPFFLYVTIPESVLFTEKKRKYFYPLILLGWIKCNYFFISCIYNQYYL